MNDLDEKILELYDELGSIKAVSKRIRCSWNRVVKSLSSSGVVINPTHALILQYHEKGLSPLEIANQMASMHSYADEIEDHVTQLKNALSVFKLD